MKNRFRQNRVQASHLAELERRYLGMDSPNVGFAWHRGGANPGLQIDGLAPRKLLVVDRSCASEIYEPGMVVVGGFTNDTAPSTENRGTLFCNVARLPGELISPSLFEHGAPFRISPAWKFRLSRLRIVSLNLSDEPTMTVEARYTIQLKTAHFRLPIIEGEWCNPHVRQLCRGERFQRYETGVTLRGSRADRLAPLSASSVDVFGGWADGPYTEYPSGVFASDTPVEAKPEMVAALKAARLLLYE